LAITWRLLGDSGNYHATRSERRLVVKLSDLTAIEL